MTPQGNPPQRRGCLFYGCISAALISLLLLIFAGLGYYLIRKAVLDSTDTAPAILEKVEYSKEQMEALQERVASFQKILDKGETNAELVLSGDDLNALLQREPSLRGTVHLRIDGDRLKGQISVPLPDAGPFKLHGRYLNAAATFRVKLSSGILDVRMDDVSVKSGIVRGMILGALQRQNLAEGAQRDPQAAAKIAKIESIRIANGEVIIRNRPAPP